jgi:uncharacterized DUF497 family protein
VRWIWDPEKNRINRRDHKMSFEIAERAFGDPLAITLVDPYPNEQRWRIIGKPSAQVAVLIIRGSYVAGGK